MKKCNVPSCYNQTILNEYICGDCHNWLIEDGITYWKENFKQSIKRREDYLQSLKELKVMCEVNGCNCEAGKKSVKYLTAKLCENHTEEYYNNEEFDKASEFIKMKNGAKKQPIEIIIQPIGSSCNIKGNEIHWGVTESILGPSDVDDRIMSKPLTIYVDPNAKGNLNVTHTTPRGYLVQEFSFGEYQYRTDSFKVNWSRHDNYNDPISDQMMKRLKPIEVSNDSDQLQRLAASNMVAAGQALGRAMNSARVGEMVSVEMTPPKSFTNFVSDPTREAIAPSQAIFDAIADKAFKPTQVNVDLSTPKGFPHLTAEQIHTIQKAIDAQPINGFIPTEKISLDTCDDSPNTYEVTEMTVTNYEEKKTMNTKELYTTPVLKEDLTDAGIRLAGRQFTKATRDVVAAAIAGHAAPGDDTLRAKVADFLKTDLGEALLQSFLSIGLSSLPESTGQIPALLARELRVSSMSGAGDVFADLLMGPLRQVTSTLIQDPPKKEPATLEAQSQNVVKVNIPVNVESEVNR